MIKVIEKSVEEIRAEEKAKGLVAITQEFFPDCKINSDLLPHYLSVSLPKHQEILYIGLAKNNRICVSDPNLLEPAIKLAEAYESWMKKSGLEGEFSVKKVYHSPASK